MDVSLLRLTNIYSVTSVGRFRIEASYFAEVKYAHSLSFYSHLWLQSSKHVYHQLYVVL